MSTTILSIVVSYVILGLLLLIFNLKTSYHWLVKSIMIVSVTFFYILTYNSFKEILGIQLAGKYILLIFESS